MMKKLSLKDNGKKNHPKGTMVKKSLSFRDDSEKIIIS